MGDSGDVLSRLRAMLDGGPPQNSPDRYTPPHREEELVNKEVESLKKENRHLKRDNEDLKRQLDSFDQSSQAQTVSHREILTQASEALIKSTSEITSLKLEIRDQSSLLLEERHKRQAAENVALGSKTQLSQIAKDKHELELRVKRLESAEIDLKRLTDVNRNLELSNASLRKQITNGAGQFHGTKATMDGLQEKAKTAELKVAKLSDQLRHVRLQNDALRIQVEENGGKASPFYPSLPSNRKTQSRGQSQSHGHGQQSSKQLVTAPPKSSILRLPSSLEKPQSVIKEILGFMSQHIHYIFEHLPPFIKSLIGIYRSFAYPSSSSSTTKIKAKTSGRGSGSIGIQGEDTVQKLIAEKASYKHALKEKELEIISLADKLESQKKQNRTYVEQFKAQERESQRYRSKKKERAFLKTAPVLPPTPALLIPIPTHGNPPRTPALLQPPAKDLAVLSEGSDTATNFSEDLRTLADLSGRPYQPTNEDSNLTPKASKDRLSAGSAFRLDSLDDHQHQHQTRIPVGGSMDDLERQIRRMTITKPDPYGDIDKAFGLDSPDTPKPKRSMAATVEDEDEVPKARVIRLGSPINSRAERYGDAYA